MYRILGLDDDEEILKQLKVFSSDFDIELSLFSKPQDAIKCIEKDLNFDLFIVDVNMPEMNGFEFSRRANELSPVRRFPIIFLTASNSVEDVKKATLIGAFGYIIKPLARKALADKLELFFSNHIRVSDVNRLKQISEESMLSISAPIEIVYLDEQSILLESLESFPFNAKYEFKSNQFKQIRLDSLPLNLKTQKKNESKNTWIAEFKIAELPSSRVEPFKALLKLWKAKGASPTAKNG